MPGDVLDTPQKPDYFAMAFGQTESTAPPESDAGVMQTAPSYFDLAFGPEQGQTETTEAPPKTTTTGALVRAAGEAVGPAAAAGAAFAKTEALTLPVLGGWSLIPSALVAAGAGAAAAWAQHKAAQAVAPELTKQFDTLTAADVQQHPVAGALGRIAAALPMFELAPLRSVGGVSALWKAARGTGYAGLSVAEKKAARSLASQVGLGTGQAVITPLLFGESPTRQGLAEAFVQSLILGDPRYEVFGRPAGEHIAREEAAKDAQAQPNVVEQPAQTYTGQIAPPLSPEERGALSVLAGKEGAGGRLTPEELVERERLVQNNTPAKAYYEQELQGWRQAIVRQMAESAKIGGELGEGKRVPEEEAEGAELPRTTGVFPRGTEPPDNVQTIVPAVRKTDGTLVEGEKDQDHDQVVKENKLKPTDIDQRLFTDTAGPAGNEITREELAAQGVPETGRTPGAHSHDLHEAQAGDEVGKALGLKFHQWDPSIPGIGGKWGFTDPATGLSVEGIEPGTSVDKVRELMESKKAPPAPAAPAAPTPEPPKPPEWTNHQTQAPEEFLKQMGEAAGEGNKRFAPGEGDKGAPLYTDLTGMTRDQAREEALRGRTATAGKGTESRKYVAMLSPADKPGGQHVVVGVLSETTSGGQRVPKVSTYDLGLGGKSPTANHYASWYDRMVNIGWKPLASIKLDEVGRPLVGEGKRFATYTPEQWAGIEAKLKEFRAEALSKAEAVAAKIQEAKPPAEAGIVAESQPELIEPPAFEKPHAEALWDAMEKHEPTSPEQVILALAKSRAFADLEPLIKDLGMDPKLYSPEEIAARIADLLFKHYENFRTMGAEGADGFTKALLSESGKRFFESREAERPGAEPVRGAEPAAAATPAAGEPGAGGAAARAAEAPATGSTVPEQPGSATAAAEQAAAVVRQRRQEAREEIQRLRPTESTTQDKALATERNLRAQGIQVQRIVDPLAKHFSTGEYKEVTNGRDNAERVIRWAMADAHDPTPDNLVTLWHEAGHAAAAREEPERLAAVLRAVRSLTDQQLGILGLKGQAYKESIPAGASEEQAAMIQQEGRLVEAMARKLHDQGFDPATAGTLAQRIWRAVKDIYHGTLMAVAKVAGYPTSSERALAYFENRMKAFLSGDKPMSWLSFLGGPAPTQDWDRAEIIRHSGINPLTNPRRLLETKEGAPAGIAVLNRMTEQILGQVNQWVASGKAIAGLTPADIVAKFIRLPKEVGEADMFTNGATPSSLVAEAATMHGANPLTKISDLPNELAQERANSIAHRLFTAWKATQDGVANKASADRVEKADRLNTVTNKLLGLAKNYVNLDHVWSVAKTSLLDLIKDSGKTVRGIREFAGDVGMAEQVARELDARIMSSDSANLAWRHSLDAVAKMITGADDARMADALQRIGQLDMDWRLPARKIAEILRPVMEKEDVFKPFLDEDPALMSAMIAFGKSNSHVMDLLAMRSSDAWEFRAQANEMLKDLMNVNRNTLAEMKERISRAFGARNLQWTIRMVRLADKITDMRDEQLSLQKEIRSAKDVEDFHRDVFSPMAGQALREIEKAAGIQFGSFEVAHGAKLRIPLLRDSPPEQFADKTLMTKTEVGKKGARPTPSNEVTGWLSLMRQWLDNPANQDHGAAFNEVLEQYDRLRDHFVTNEHRDLQDSVITRWAGPLTERSNQLGTEVSRLIGQAWNHYGKNFEGNRPVIRQGGTNFEAAINNARKAFGYPGQGVQGFWDNVVGPALHDVEQNQEKFWVGAPSRDVAVERAIQHVVNAMKPASPEAKSAAEKMIREGVKNSDHLVQNNSRLGLKVMDRDGQDYNVFRRVLGASPFVWPRALSEIAHNFYHEHLKPAWGGDKLKPGLIAEAYRTDPNALRAALQPRFTPRVWDWFVRSLAYNDRPTFYAPGTGNLKPLAVRQHVIDAYESAAADPVKFAENLSVLHGVAPTPEFVGDTMDTLQQFNNLLRTMVGDEAEGARTGSPAPKRFISDARQLDAAPKEWLNYLMLNTHNMERIVRYQAHASAFGRNGAAMLTNLETARQEQSLMAQRYDSWTKEIKKADPSITEKELQDQVRAKASTEGVPYNALVNAGRNLRMLGAIGDHYKALSAMNNSQTPPELRPFARAMRAIAGWTVSGMGTAISAHSVFLEQPIRLAGLSLRSLAMTGRSLADFSKVMGNVMAQTFGHEVIFEANRMLDANEAGLFDPINSNAQRLVSAYNNAEAAYRTSGRIGKAIGRTGDVAQAVLQSDLWLPGARQAALERQAAGEPIAPSFKPFSPFHTIAEALKFSNFITWQRKFESMVVSGVKYLEAHPWQVYNPDLEFTRQMLSGFGAGDREFRMLTDQLSRYGQSIEQMARDAYANRGTGKPILSEEFNRSVQHFMLNEITLESSLTSRHPSLQTNGLGVAMNPFLGWPLQKSYQVFRHMREPDGRATMSALRQGLTSYMAIIPLGMAVAWLRNKFDEHVVGRKQNISDIGMIHDAKSAFMTALDNTSRVGTFGLLGEGANYFLNDDNVRPVTLDNRIFFVNTIQSLFNAARGLYHQTLPQLARGDIEGAKETATDYQTVLRPIFQALGGNGLLQNLGALNHFLSVDDAEARVSNRISVNNYLRVAGRELDMDVRTFGGMLQSATSPNPLKPYTGKMILAAYANDHEAFNDAMRGALREIKSQDPKITQPDAMKKLVSLYEGQNPLRIVFRSAPTERDYQRILAQLPGDGRRSVQEAINLYEHYGQQIGARQAIFGREKSSAQGIKLPALTLDQMRMDALTRGYSL